jgi:formate/nitrite transporter
MMKLCLAMLWLSSADAFLASPARGFVADRSSLQTRQPALVSKRTMAVKAQLATPPEGFAGAVAAGEKKAGMAPGDIFGLGTLAGALIGFGAYLALSIGAACPGLAASNPGLQKIVFGAFGLPLGLFMTLVTGTELFTGNTALVTMAMLEKKADFGQLLKSWTCSFAGNFVGAIGLAFLGSVAATLPGGGASVAISATKTTLPFAKLVARGILCNWLVCMAVYMASMAKDAVGKMTAIWFPISAFVAMGFEHSVANMFIIPLAIFSAGSVTWKAFLLGNLLPVTLGNIIGGALCVAFPYHLFFGKKH